MINKYQPGTEFGYGGAGLVARIPFVEQIHWIDKRVLSLEMDNQPVLSTDQLRLEVDAFARFRIRDPLQMYISARTEENLVNQLKPILASALRNEFGRRPSAALLTPERGEMMTNIKNALNRVAAQYGAEIVDVRIKRADLPNGTPLDSAYERMRTARRQEATSIIAQGNRAGDDHPRRRRCRGGRHLCGGVQPGRGILRFLPRHAVLPAELPRPAGGRPARAVEHHPVAEQRLSASIQGQSLNARVIQIPFSVPI